MLSRLITPKGSEHQSPWKKQNNKTKEHSSIVNNNKTTKTQQNQTPKSNNKQQKTKDKHTTNKQLNKKATTNKPTKNNNSTETQQPVFEVYNAKRFRPFAP